MALETYRAKRHFDVTPEPEGEVAEGQGPLRFVIHEHHATRLHYDLRLELDGVLKCWAVPKGPSFDPKTRRLAVETEDHPLQYLDFAGVIPEGQYGAGPMSVWDHGTWAPDGDAHAALAKGHLRFRLEGERLHGRWSLVHTHPKDGGKQADKQWLLIKSKEPAPSEVAPRAPAAQLATAASGPPRDDGWLSEVKHDGYRLLATKTGPRVSLATRGGLDWTSRFPRVARAIAALPAATAVLDGEAVVLDAQGRSDFGALQQAIGRDDARIVYVAFDCLHLDGADLASAPLVTRKDALHGLLGRAPPAASAVVLYGDHVVGQTEAFHREACALGLEGSIFKRADAPYTPGRSRAWLKVKCLLRQELVIVGWTDPKGTREAFGALLLGVHDDDGALRYAGKVGTGLDRDRLRDVLARLAPLARKTPAVTHAPRARGIHWVEPTLVAEVAFREWTRDGLVRQSVFVGVREDKPAADIVRERAAPPDAPTVATSPAVRNKPRAVTTIAGVRLTHPDKLIEPELGLTKIELAEYYLAAAPRMLPYLADRPLSLVRCPDGLTGACFYQKHARRGVPDIVRRVQVPGDDDPYLVVDDVSGLLSLVHFGVAELHVGDARAADLDAPDMAVLDLDPGPDVPWSRVAGTARALGDQLAALGLVPFLRWTGGKGLHVVTPLGPGATWDGVRSLTLGLALVLAARDPQRYTAKLSKDQRAGRIFVDYLRNSLHATAICSWSVRARPGAPVATPLAWDDLDPRRPPRASVRDVRAALESGQPNPWADFEHSRRTLNRSMLDAIASLLPGGQLPSG